MSSKRCQWTFLAATPAWLFLMAGSCSNRGPSRPVLKGPSRVGPYEAVCCTVSSVDPEGDAISYMLAWGDTSPVEWSPLYASGMAVVREHEYTQLGGYGVTVRAKDDHERESRWSDVLHVVVGTEAPCAPSCPSGPTACSTGVSVTFLTAASDPDGDSVSLQFDWGDRLGEWSSFRASGAASQDSCAFDTSGTYLIRARAMDPLGAVSPWSVALPVLVAGPAVRRGGPPTNVKIEALTDTTVKITWSFPIEGTPDKYTVNFMEVGAAGYAQLAEVTTTMYEHSPNGATGSYKVTAVFGSNTYDGAVVKSVPVHTAAATVAELNAMGNAGYGWNQTSGVGSTYSMDEVANAPNVDFYITDFAVGYAGTTYNIASPDLALPVTDPGGAGVVEPGAWRVNAFADRVPDPQVALPEYVLGQTYYGLTALDVDPAFIPVYLRFDGYYALVKVWGRNQSAGTVQVETWFQKVRGLRLIRH